MYTRHHDLANAHQHHAHLHQHHAQTLQNQAQFHQHQARMHQHQAEMLGQQIAGQPYDARHTAYANHVSPAALVFHGEVSPQAIASLQQFHHPFAGQNGAPHLSNHMAHAVENQNAMTRGYRF